MKDYSFVTFLVNLSNDKKNRRLRHQNFFRSVYFYFQCVIFHICSKYHLDQIGAIHRKRVELLGNFKTSLLSFRNCGAARFAAYDFTFLDNDFWRFWGAI